MNTALIIAIAIIITIPVLLLLPTISIDSAAVISSSAFSYIRAGLYFLPIGTVGVILQLILAFWIVRMVIAFVKMVWDVLPVGK